ncbi:hypothetical protein DLAC_05051 [Tieghemostelium lacteum]|uniref:Uncharacterized protein n=1 Tax=Tieghemostelium lacteum TaxID=361077 RepID=A0A151ZI71_TIELA|nr:hypothetical protein DLAC_05051 [Tieghemostelium lacteum]|eukprot:KYQ93666.1 hypothetical protein DLAC_05051 [Tieghemostelium lacteum]
MVKFLPFGLFDNQNLLPSSESEDEPIDIIPALNDFLISTKGGEIIHYCTAGTECSIVNRFSTQNNQILQIYYIPSNDSIMTMEKDMDKSTINVVRFYQNWRQNQVYIPSGQDGSPLLGTSPSINGNNNNNRGDGNSIGSSHGGAGQFNFYKIPVPSTVVSANVCPISSRVVVSTQSTVSVWDPIYNIHSSTLISHFEKILDIQVENVTKVAIFECYLSYSTSTDVKVLSLNLEQEHPISSEDDDHQSSNSTSTHKLNKSRSSSTNSLQSFNQHNNIITNLFSSTPKSTVYSVGNSQQSTPVIGSGVNNGPSQIVEDENYFEVSFDLHGQPTGKNQLPNLQSSIDAQRKLTSNGEYEVLGPINDIEHGINVNSESGYSLLSSTLLLSKKFSKDDSIHSMFFLPDSTLKNQVIVDIDIESASSPSLSSSTSSITNQQRNRSNSMSSQLNISGNSSSSPSKQPKQFRLNSSMSSSFGKITTSSSPSLRGSHQNTNTGTGGNSGSGHGSGTGTSPQTLMRFIISTQKNGYLYNISKPTLLANYLYANETIACTASYSFLYTITTEGLETWTLRSCEGAEDGEDLPSPLGFGQRTFLFLKKIAVVGDHLIILSKFGKQENNKLGIPTIMRSPNPKKPAMQELSGWSTYILHHTPLQSLYNEILEKTIEIKDKDEEVYHQLLMESHFLLQSKLANQHHSNPKMNDMASVINFGVERKIYQSLLKKSSTLLGEYFFSKQKDYMRSALWFSSSDSDIEYVFKLLIENSTSHQSLIYYLEHVLYDPSSYELLLNREELCNQILDHYHKCSPHRLPSLILESSISSYSQTLAIELLKKISEQCDFDLIDRNKIYFALGLLYLDQNKIEDAISSFNQIPTDSLISLCVKNPKLLAPPGESTPTALCKILRQSTPWGLLDITIQLVQSHEISPDFGLTILLFSTTTFTNGIMNPIYHHNDYDLDSLLLKIYLEWFITVYANQSNSNIGNTTPKPQQHTTLTTTHQQQNTSSSSINQNYNSELVVIFLKYLINLYVQDIHRFRGEDFKLFQSLKLDVGKILNSTYYLQQLSSSSMGILPKNIPTSKSAISNQNQLGDEYCNQWMLMHLNTYLSIPQWLSKLPPFLMENNNPSAKDEVKTLLSPLYYRKLQSLLSLNKIKDFQFMETIESIFQNNNDNIMLLSLKLACLPPLDRVKEAIELAVDTNIHIILDYSLHFCKIHSDWATVLSTVLKRYQSQSLKPTEKEITIREYEKVLDHLTSFLDPEAFLHLLPSNGKMDYFLTFIEKSFSNHQAKLLKTSLSYHLLEMDNDTI